SAIWTRSSAFSSGSSTAAIRLSKSRSICSMLSYLRWFCIGITCDLSALVVALQVGLHDLVDALLLLVGFEALEQPPMQCFGRLAQLLFGVALHEVWELLGERIVDQRLSQPELAFAFGHRT